MSHWVSFQIFFPYSILYLQHDLLYDACLLPVIQSYWLSRWNTGRPSVSPIDPQAISGAPPYNAALAVDAYISAVDAGHCELIGCEAAIASDGVPRFSSQNRWCCKMARQRCDGTWTTTPKSSLFCPLCVSVATVSYHLEVPHPPVPSNGFSPLSCSFDFGLPCFFFCSLLHVAFSLEALILSPYCFICFPLSSFFVLFHLIPCCLLLSLSFPALFSPSFLLFTMGFSVLCSLTSKVVHRLDPLDKHSISKCACRHAAVHKGA